LIETGQSIRQKVLFLESSVFERLFCLFVCFVFGPLTVFSTIVPRVGTQSKYKNSKQQNGRSKGSVLTEARNAYSDETEEKEKQTM